MEFLRTIIIFIFVVSELGYILTQKGVESSNNSSLCTRPKCIMKCCPFGKYLTTRVIEGHRERICDHFDNSTRTFASLVKDLFYVYPEISNLNFTIKAGIFEANETFKTEFIWLRVNYLFKLHLTEYLDIYLEVPNAYNRWILIPNDKFCWEYKISRSKEKVSPRVFLIFPEDERTPSWFSTDFLDVGILDDEPGTYYPAIKTILLYAADIGMLLTCFFLLVVLVVYALLPELRNLCGQILMAYSASLFSAFFLLFVLRISPHSATECIILATLTYYFLMASFCWLNVMSYEIWCSFRFFVKSTLNHRRGVNFKFLRYCLYAFGLPLGMTITTAVLNEIDMSHVPWFVTPKIPFNGCFFDGPETFFYLYIPMLILILCNWMFYLMTAWELWRLRRGTAVLGSAASSTPHARRTLRHRFMVYVKLSAVMGLHWVLVVVRSRYPGYNMWLITDFYNILIGLTIFLIFVCKRNILRKLKERYTCCRSKRGGRLSNNQQQQLPLTSKT